MPWAWDFESGRIGALENVLTSPDGLWPVAVECWDALSTPKAYWTAIVAKASEIVGKPALFIGDFNTGRHYFDESGATFSSAQFMDLIEAAGFKDIWRERNGEAREFSWYSTHGNGFRLDHTFASPSLAEIVKDVYYSHREREDGISDHSIMIVEY